MRVSFTACLLGALLAGVVAPALAQTTPTWHQRLSWHGHVAQMQAQEDGGYVLAAPGKRRVIAPQRWHVQTASVMFDGLFAMAQADLALDAVDAIHDPAYNHGHPIPCHCYVAGGDWPFVWTRDLSYSTNLALWRVDPVRARNSLLFKVSSTRGEGVPPGKYIIQDTGSGGSWPVSTDRVVWFLGAQDLLGDKAFARTTYTALVDTMRQDRRYTFDPATGLYRGETSFLDWRQQSYPAWTADNVVFIAQSFALSTNILHYDALRLGQHMASKRNDTRAAARFKHRADALKQAINKYFWRADKGLYMSYIGGRVNPAPFDAYDLLGTDLAILSGVADGQRARKALADYPVVRSGSPVIWPERHDQPVYHNRAVWPFVTAYTLRAARHVNEPARIAHALRSMVRAAALNASNMENFPLDAPWLGAVGKKGRPVVDSQNQLWSVSGYLDMVLRGVFGLTDGGQLKPKLPVSLVPMLFGSHDTIELDMGKRHIVLRRPPTLDGNLLVAGNVQHQAHTTMVQLVTRKVQALAMHHDGAVDLPATPPAPEVAAKGKDWKVTAAQPGMLYINGHRHGKIDSSMRVPRNGDLQCFSTTASGSHQLPSLHSPETCVGAIATVQGTWPRHRRVPRTSQYALWLRYDNDHGPINTGITAAVKRMQITCGKSKAQVRPVVMPQSDGEQDSTVLRFHAMAGQTCRFALEQGFNMSDLAKSVDFTRGQGGVTGPLNKADVGALKIAPLPGPPLLPRPDAFNNDAVND